MYLKVAPEIRRALQGKRPVVALESTIITHGMPYPENLETARSLESQVRAVGGGARHHRGDGRRDLRRSFRHRTGVAGHGQERSR
jgi:Indigoidine synthase A like protein